MEKLMISVLTIGILAAAMAEVEEPPDMVRAKASYQAQVTFAKQSYLQKLESMKKLPSLTKSQVDAIEAEIAKVKGQSAETPATSLPDAAPEKPGANTVDIKAGKLTEFPNDLTASGWDRLPGKVIKVDAAEESYFKESLVLKDGESYFAVPHPTDKWNISKKISCTWEGLPLDEPKYDSSTKVGRLSIWVSRTDGKNNSWTSFNFSTPIIGPLRICFNPGSTFEKYPRIYYNGEIRIKLVPAE